MKTLITILLSFSLQIAFAQNAEAIKNAFSKSYTLENSKQYQKLLMKLRPCMIPSLMK